MLTIDEFFEGNSTVGSIGCNLSVGGNLEVIPSPEMFYSLFQRFAQRAEVKDIRVQITTFDDPNWPFSDTVYIMTTASPEEVASWFPEDLTPNETWVGFLDREVYEPYTVPAGVQPVACWWD